MSHPGFVPQNRAERGLSEQSWTETTSAAKTQCELIDSTELARRWRVPESWVRDGVRRRAGDKIPHVRFGKYVRFEFGCPDLDAWLARRRCCKDRPR